MYVYRVYNLCLSVTRQITFLIKTPSLMVHTKTILRDSSDNLMNTFGRSLIDMCATLKLTIMDGLYTGDEGGAFTFISPNGNSVVDRFLVSCCLLNCNISINLHVYNEILSWYRPISMSLKFNDNDTHRDKTQATHMNTKVTKIKWDPDKQHHFINEFKSSAVTHQLDDLFKIIGK